MSKKTTYKQDRILLMELKTYLKSKNIGKYILSTAHQKEYINSYTLRMNMAFKNMDILFNPNKVFLYGNSRSPNDKDNYIIVERIKYAKVEELDSSIIVGFVCGDLYDDNDNHTYNVYIEKLS